MVSTLVVSSKGMYLRVWMLFTSVFTCICYRMYIHKISLTCHKHMHDELMKFTLIQVFRLLMPWNLNVLKFWKRLEILKGFHKLKSFQSYQKFLEDEFTTLIYILWSSPILQNVLELMNFIFGIGVKTHLSWILWNWRIWWNWRI